MLKIPNFKIRDFNLLLRHNVLEENLVKEQKNIKHSYIPTIEEMQCWYEDNLRGQASKLWETESNKKTEDRGTFFNTFRKFEELDDKIHLDSQKENIYYRKYKDYVEIETSKMGKNIEEIENLIEYESFFLRFERRVNKESNHYNHFGTNSAT